MTPSVAIVLLLAVCACAYPRGYYGGGAKGGGVQTEPAYYPEPTPEEDSGPSLQDKFKDFYDKASEKAKEVWDDTKDTVKSAQEKVKDFVDDAKDKAKDAFHSAKEKTEVFVDDAKEKVTELWKKGVDQIRDVLDGLKKKAQDGKDGAEDAWNDRKDNVENFWHKLSGQDPAKQEPKDLEQIPQIEEGSYKIETTRVSDDKGWDNIPLGDGPVVKPVVESWGDKDDKSTVDVGKVIPDVEEDKHIEVRDKKPWGNKDIPIAGDKPIVRDDKLIPGVIDDKGYGGDGEEIIPDGDKIDGGAGEGSWNKKDEVIPDVIGERDESIRGVGKDEIIPGVVDDNGHNDEGKEIIPDEDKTDGGAGSWNGKDDLVPGGDADKPIGGIGKDEIIPGVVDNKGFGEDGKEIIPDGDKADGGAGSWNGKDEVIPGGDKPIVEEKSDESSEEKGTVQISIDDTRDSYPAVLPWDDDDSEDSWKWVQQSHGYSTYGDSRIEVDEPKWRPKY